MSEAESRVTRNQEIVITPQKRSWIRPMLVAAIAVALNIIAYLIIPPDLAYRLGSLGYIGVFLITLISNERLWCPFPTLGW